MELEHSDDNWEEKELDNTFRGIAWVLKPIFLELTLCRSIKIEYGEFVLWLAIFTSIESVLLLESVSSICDCAFDGLKALKLVQIPKSVVYIREKAFVTAKAWGQSQFQT